MNLKERGITVGDLLIIFIIILTTTILFKASNKDKKSLLNLIDLIEKKEGTAYTCAGCLRWNRPINEIIKEIKHKNS